MPYSYFLVLFNVLINAKISVISLMYFVTYLLAFLLQRAVAASGKRK